MRKPGFYWVKKADRFTDLYDGWSVCEYVSSVKQTNDRYWYFDDRLVGDSYWDEIDEHRIVRDINPGFIEVSLGRWVEIPEHKSERDKEIERRCNAIIEFLKNS